MNAFPHSRMSQWGVGTKLLAFTIPPTLLVVVLTTWAVYTGTTANLEQKLTSRAQAIHTQINEQTPRLVLLDLKLPKVDGLEVLKQVKGNPRTKHTPIVMMTASSEEPDLVASYSLDVNSYIVKLVDSVQFVEAARTLGLYWLLLNERPVPSTREQRTTA